MNKNSWVSRWTQSQIHAMLLEQHASFWQRDTGIERTQLASLQNAANLPHAIIVSGLRRAGKSTLLAQQARQIGEAACYYINFEDERFLGFQADDMPDLHTALMQLFGVRRIFILDEVQNVPEWERFVRRLMDTDHKFYITGSNAALLSRELGTRLTGRYLSFELFPFSFREFLQFTQRTVPDPTRLTNAQSAQFNAWLLEYARLGGIPESLKYPQFPLLRTLYDDVLHRDIAARHRIEDVRALRELAYFLMSNPASLVSFNRLKEQLGLGSVNTVKNYIEYMENSWLLFTVNAHSYSVRRQQIAPKKIYPIDSGLAQAVGFNFSENLGKWLETLVFLALRRTTNAVYYYTTPNNHEVDFYLPQTQQLFQVSHNLHQPSTREREIRALCKAMQALNLQKSCLLSLSPAETVQVAQGTIEIYPLARWLLEN